MLLYPWLKLMKKDVFLKDSPLSQAYACLWETGEQTILALAVWILNKFLKNTHNPNNHCSFLEIVLPRQIGSKEDESASSQYPLSNPLQTWNIFISQNPIKLAFFLRTSDEGSLEKHQLSPWMVIIAVW